MSRKSAELGFSGAGGKGGGGSTFQEDENSLQTNSIVRSVEVVSEGPVKGIKGGAKGIYLNDTPLQNDDGSFNFGGKVQWDQRFGFPDQAYMPGFEGANSEVLVSTEVTALAAVVRTTSSANIDAVRVTVNLPQGIYQQDANENKLQGSSVELAVDKKLSSSGSWVTDRQWVIEGKTTSSYDEAVRISRPVGTGTWDIRVRRITPDNASSLLRNNTSWSRMTEIQEVQLEYPDAAYYGLAVDAAAAGTSSIPVRSVVLEGLLCRVPSNYNTSTREYTGVWDGTFKLEWTDNPAWPVFEVITNQRFGLGDPLDDDMVDEYSFYNAAVYNDGLVPDGKGGTQPRYTFNAVIFQREEGLSLIQKMASSMDAKVVWLGGRATLLQDRPVDWQFTITKANVVVGTDPQGQPEAPFSYSSTTLQDRITAAHVTWNDPANGYLPRVSTVEAAPGFIDRYDYNATDIAAFGCTNEGQAIRKGKWYLESVLNQLAVVSFKMTYEGFTLIPHDVVKIYDEDYVGQKNGGRLLAGSTTTSLLLDRPATLTAGSTVDLTYLDGTTVTRNVVETAGNPSVITLSLALPSAPEEYTTYIISTDIVPRQFRLSKISQADSNLIAIEGIEYDPNKYNRIEFGVDVPAPVFSAVPDSLVSVPQSLSVRETAVLQDNTVKRTLLVSWSRPAHGVVIKYDYQYQRSKGGWTTGTTKASSFEIDNALPGDYEIQVTATSYAGIVGPAAKANYSLTIDGSVASPFNAPTNLVEAVSGGTSFAGSNLTFKWTNPSSNSSVLSAGIKDFQVRIKHSGTDALLRTYYVEAVVPGQQQNSTYTYTMNDADTGGVPRRNVKVEVRIRDTSNNLSFAAVNTFNNPAPAVPSNLAAVAGIGNAKLSWTTPTESDYVGVLVWRSTTNGFTPSSANLVYETTANYISDPNLSGGTNVYYRVAAYDTFGKSDTGAGLNLSPQQTIMPLVQPGIPEVTSLPTVAGYTGPKLIYNVTDKKLYSLVDGAWVQTIPEVSGVADGTITTAKFATGLVGIEVFSAAPTTGNFEGRQYFNTTDGKLYRYHSGVWLGTIPSTDITGQLTNAQIADLAAAKITGQVVAAQIADAAVTTAKFATTIRPIELFATAPTTGNTEGRQYFNTTDGLTYRYHSGAWTAAVPAVTVTGTLTDAQLSGIAATKVTGQLVAAQIADATLTAAKFSNAARPVESVATLPTTGNFAGRVVFLTTDSQIYRYTGSAWLNTVPAVNITGQLTSSQLAAIEATKVSGTLTDAQLSAISAAKVTGQLVSTQIGDLAITAPKVNFNIGGGNLIANSSFEVDSNADGWPDSWENLIGFGTPSLSTDAKFQGKALSMVTLGGTPTPRIRMSNSRPYFGVGETLMLSAWVKATGVAQLGLKTYSAASGGSDLGTLGSPNFALDGTWQRMVFKATTAVAGYMSITIGLVNTPAAGVTFLVDGAQMEMGDVPTSYAPKADEILPGTITSTFIADDAITTPKILAGAITTGTLAAGAVTATNIATGTITATQIAGSTITGTKIAAGTITGTNIAADAITANHILAGTITTTEIAAGTIVAADIAASTITGSNIAATTITSGNIVVGTLTGDRLAANTITGSKIAADTITATNIAAGTITATELAAGSVTSGKIAAGVVTASEIGANTITSDKLLIVASNLIPNPDFATGTFAGWRPWGLPANQSVVAEASADVPTGAPTRFVAKMAHGAGTLVSTFSHTLAYNDVGGGTDGIAVTAGEQYSVSIDATIATGTVSTVRDVTVYWHMADVSLGAGAYNQSATVIPFMTAINQTWQTFTGSFTVPAGAVRAHLFVRFTGTAGAMYWTNLRAARKATGQLIVDGTITGTKLVAGTITGGLIAADTVTSANILAGTITGTEIAASTISGSKIAANTLTAANIAGGSITGDRLTANTITAGQIAAGAIGATQIAADAINATHIAANAITTSELAANSVTTAKILAANITGDKIAANSITADHIVSATITANEIASGTITANLLAADSVTAGAISAGAVGASEIAAGAITAGKMAITDLSNLVYNGTGKSLEGWSSQFISNSASGFTYWAGQGVISDSAINFGARDAFFGPQFPAQMGDQFWVRAETTPAGGGTSSNTMAIGLACYNATGTIFNWIAGAVRPIGAAGKVSLEGSVTVPAGTASVQVWVQLDIAGGTSVLGVAGKGHHATNIQVRRKNAGSLIVDGAITGNKIAADTITGNNILGGTITTNELYVGSTMASRIQAANIASGAITTVTLAADAVTTDKIAAGAVTATEIAASTITGTKIAGGTITGTNITGATITAGNIAVGTLTGDRLAASTITGTKIAADTITAANMAVNSITAENAALANASITTAKIANLAVDTLQVANGAITATVAAIGSAGTATPATNGTNVSTGQINVVQSTIAMNAVGTGGGVLITATTFARTIATTSSSLVSGVTYVRLMKRHEDSGNVTQLRLATLQASAGPSGATTKDEDGRTIAWQYFDVVAVGTYTYWITIECVRQQGASGFYCTYDQPGLSLHGAKK